MKHKSNAGYIDEEGNWHCWKCTKENEFFYPRGKVVAKFKIPDQDILIRIVCTGEHDVVVEAWDIKNIVRLNKRLCNYLSTGQREFERLLRRYLYNERHPTSEEFQPVLRVETPSYEDTSTTFYIARSDSGDLPHPAVNARALDALLDILENSSYENAIIRTEVYEIPSSPTIFIHCTVHVPPDYIENQTDEAIETNSDYLFYDCITPDNKILYPKLSDRLGRALSFFCDLLALSGTISVSDLIFNIKEITDRN